MVKYDGCRFNNVVSVEINNTNYKSKSVWVVWVTNKDPNISRCAYVCEDFNECVEWMRLNVTESSK